MAKPIKHLLLSAVACLGVAGSVRAADTATPPGPTGTQTAVPDRMEPVTPQFTADTANVGITEHLGEQLPLGLHFTDTAGHAVTLDDYFHHGKPVILQLGYFNCPQLCDVVSRALMDGVKDLDLQMGRDYDVLYVSINPDEHWELGQRKKRTFVEEYGKEGAVEGWNFVVGKQPQIEQVARAVGFGYKKVENREEFSHPPMIVILTADGKISRYFYNFQYPPALLRTGLVEAGQGKIGSYTEQLLLAVCYHFDEYSGKYSADYMKMMQVGGILTVLVMGVWLGSRWIKDARAARRDAAAAPNVTPGVGPSPQQHA